VAGLAADVFLGHRPLLDGALVVDFEHLVAGGVAGGALGLPSVLLPVRFPLLVQVVPLLVEELVAAAGRVLDQEALLPLRANHEDDVLHLGRRAADVGLGRAGIALAVLGPVIPGVLQQAVLAVRIILLCRVPFQVAYSLV